MALQEIMRCCIVFSDLTLVSGICLAGVNRCERLCGQVWMSVSGICSQSGTPVLLGTVHTNPISVDCRRFTPPFGERLVALSSSSLEHLIDTILETGFVGFVEREVVAVFVYLRDC
ncbi:ribulose bisphosphate carboxylase small chain, chloroplastic-like [Dorcoceras hygrometricum]|uniref:Ribulose bisphosphate carboxylase small chain, chloroplastic-like n=1 Tax=Dorcoceras hygrometricum TaxID=472368 RepID=A0A2Z7AKG7_9LAMI|nr:ribulose bisphosphate carboxylase small chain, chloroplastic-like [Dorcoceras hygrometricum]